MMHVSLPAGAAPLRLIRESGRPEGRLLTIVITSYNHRRYIEELFVSIEACRRVAELALIIVDDGSTDDTISCVATYPFATELHVRAFDKANAGLRDSLASGLALAATPFVAFIASDDHYVSDGLDAAVAMLHRAPTRDLCWIYQATYLQGLDGQKVYGGSRAALFAGSSEQRERGLSIEFPKPLLLQSTIFGTELLRAVGAWSEPIVLDDWPTYIKVAHHAQHHAVDMRMLLDVTLCRYRIHENGVHNDSDRQLRICLETAGIVVSQRYRREATANILADVALMKLYDGEMGGALKLFAKSVRTFPRLKTAYRPIKRIVFATMKRLGVYVRN